MVPKSGAWRENNDPQHPDYNSEGLRIILSACPRKVPTGANQMLACSAVVTCTCKDGNLWRSMVLPAARAGAAQPVWWPPSYDPSSDEIYLPMTELVMQAATCPSTRRRAPRRSTATTSRRTSRRSRAWTATPASRASCSGAGPASTPPRSLPPPTSMRPPPSVRPLPAPLACSQATQRSRDNCF